MTLPGILFFACVAASIWCLTGMAIHMLLVIRHRKPGCPLFRNWYAGPFHNFFKASALTEQGLQSRRRFLLNLFGFLAALGIGIAIGIVFGS